MSRPDISGITSFIWHIADDVLRDIYVRGRYRNVIIPMLVIRRLDAALEDTKQHVLAKKKMLDEAGIVDQELPLTVVTGFPFYNTSKFTLRDLANRGEQHQLRADFIDYLDGFSKDVQDIILNFELRNEVPKLSRADALGRLIRKFLDPSINLSPKPELDGQGKQIQPALDNHAMGTIFEDLIRRFNEANNEESGEHWTPRDVVRLMTNLIFRPISDTINPGTYTVYDGACGTGGMLTVAYDNLRDLAARTKKDINIHLYGQEISSETYAIAKADLLLKGDGAQVKNLRGGPDFSTLSNDGFPTKKFDFMLSNPPYGKSWKTDLEKMGGRKGITDRRFIVSHGDATEFSLLTRSSDGQMLFMANMISKMRDTPLGSRIATVHNGSSLFSGDAGQGMSNIRQWILQNDWLEAIIGLPLNMFYNTGIATFIWILSNRKTEDRKGKVQLIDATSWFKPLEKNLGRKNCELTDEHIERIMQAFLELEDSEHSKMYELNNFGYHKITVERPLRQRSQLKQSLVENLKFASGDQVYRAYLLKEIGEDIFECFDEVKQRVKILVEQYGILGDEEAKNEPIPGKTQKKLLDKTTWERDFVLLKAGEILQEEIGKDIVFENQNAFRVKVEEVLKEKEIKLSSLDKKIIFKTMSWEDPGAEKVIKKIYKSGKQEANPLYGFFEIELDGKKAVVEYETDSNLRDNEQVSLLEDGGIEAFFKREVLPHAEDAWINQKEIKIGFEISFSREFYKPAPMRTLEAICLDIKEVREELMGSLRSILGEVKGD